ncbi:MAG: PIN domain-containing protein [Plectolyngbya sp. WJT66-NPBG17]|jgi:predicted nucleic acid-binding protein|nr:PIN domain-containing protein [Plectolyngbya sp. WJT66-NPBG17]MBW4526028.1 PIN domain-containing protein [Phormidium tanganyikae FI6-MK23]
MRILVDTNIVLDIFLNRQPFAEEASALLATIAMEQVQGYVCASSLTDIFYIARRQTKSINQGRRAIAMTLRLFHISLVDRAILEAAFNSELSDFEDAVQIACAVTQNLDAIVTRNARDFQTNLISVLSIADLLQQIT